MVMRMCLQVLGELVYPLREQRYLDLGGTGIAIANLIVRDDSALLLFVQIIFLLIIRNAQLYHSIKIRAQSL